MLPSEVRELHEKQKQLDKRIEQVYDAAITKVIGVINRNKELSDELKQKLIKEILK